MKKVSFNLNGLNFEALHEKQNTTKTVLFATGSGGNPERHLPLLEFLSVSGFTVIAPYFERIVSPTPGLNELSNRSSILSLAANLVEDTNAQLVGVGHSIGATLLVGLAGGKIWLNESETVQSVVDDRIKRLVLFAPPTGFFQAPDSLTDVKAPIQVWYGSNDKITSPQQVEMLKSGLSKSSSIESRVIEGAGHFSFMNTLPPTIVDSLENRSTFLSNLQTEVVGFATKN